MSEIQNDSYYKDKIESRFIDIDLSSEIAIEKYFATVVFSGEWNRMVYSPLDSTFRRRIETLDKGKIKNQKYTPVTLDLPYGSYYRTTDWEDDDRFATKQTGQMLTGEYDLTFFRRIRSRAVKSTWTATFFFSKQDEIRAAKQMIDWEANPKGPAQIYDTVSWKGMSLNVPVFITVDKIDTKPAYNELDFLTKQRIFPMTVEMTVRSYQVLLNANGFVYLPFRFKRPEPDDLKMYITHETSLEFALWRFDLDSDSGKQMISKDEISEYASKYFEKEGPFTAEQLTALAAKLPADTTVDILKGYFTDSSEVTLNFYQYNVNKSTPTKAVIEFQVKPADRKYFQKMVILVPGHGEFEITDYCQKSLEVDGLEPNSTYKCQILTYSINNEVKQYSLTFTTKTIKNDPTPTPKKINKIGGLVGVHL